MKKHKTVSLFECMEARYPVKGDVIYCRKGHKFIGIPPTIDRMAHGSKLRYLRCSTCPDLNYERMRYPDERGWL